MDHDFLNYQLADDTVIFTDTLKKDSPYHSVFPRNHESLFFVTNGTLLYKKKDKKEVIREGQTGYIERGAIDKSSAYLCDEVSYIAVNFCFDKKSAAPQKTLPFDTLCSQGDAYGYQKLFSEALNHFLSKTPGYLAICNGIVLQIIGFLYNEFKIDDTGFKKIQKLDNAIEYLRNHYDNTDFRISNLADIVNMSEKNFRRIFFDIYRKTPYTFLQEFRINKAEILLLNTSKTISDIALQCGFSDVFSFSHCFKKHIGISPSKFRVTHTKDS
ncbi:MAG TPA: AraC family transcriptional regulator [Candidatus Eisenbergiella merdipullorum]|uniref:AraC family transcriptional regulator n=1 Tax=Candidatus Eisenbergiella merdipullorum TaxID=2838553 RepID=A0A9D2KY55_9FIRM|nr:AraC family transcriptional regulator [Candidatus Eisenbergiella merdipullorum]